MHCHLLLTFRTSLLERHFPLPLAPLHKKSTKNTSFANSNRKTMLLMGFWCTSLAISPVPVITQGPGDSSNCSCLLGLSKRIKSCQEFGAFPITKNFETLHNYFQEIVLLVSQMFITENCFIYFMVYIFCLEKWFL